MNTPTFKPGDLVFVTDPESFIGAKKLANRQAVVEWVGPDHIGQFKGRMKVRFLKRNGRGKEFDLVMQMRDFALCEST